jgi:hypothetical protein
LTYIPISIYAPVQGEESAHIRFVGKLVSDGFSGFVQRASVVEENAPSAGDSRHWRAGLTAAAEVTISLDNLARFRTKQGEHSLESAIDSFHVIRPDWRAAVPATDPLAAPPIRALKPSGVRVLDYD